MLKWLLDERDVYVAVFKILCCNGNVGDCTECVDRV